MATVTRNSIFALSGAAVAGVIIGTRYHAEIQKGFEQMKKHLLIAKKAVKDNLEAEKSQATTDTEEVNTPGDPVPEPTKPKGKK